MRLCSKDSHCPESQPSLPPHATHRQLCPLQAKHSLRPRPLPTVLTGPDAPTLWFWAGGGGRARGLAGKPWVWPRDL